MLHATLMAHIGGDPPPIVANCQSISIHTAYEGPASSHKQVHAAVGNVRNACTTVAECSARRQPLPLLSGAMWHSHFSACTPVDPRSVWKCRGSSSRGWELLNVAAAVAIRCSEARGNLGCAGTGSALHETVGVLIDFEFEAKSPLGLQQCKDHASPLAQFCTMWAVIVHHRKHRLPKVSAGTAGNLLEQLTHSCRW